jgi:toxin ParE1/3/4
VNPARLRPAAENDLLEKTRYYRSGANSQVAERFFDAAISALQPIERSPKSGSPRLGLWCGIPEMRTGKVNGFPVRWYYLEGKDHLDVIRLLNDRQDIEALLDHQVEDDP